MKPGIQYRSRERGFVALVSAVIMSAILISLMYTVGASSFYARSDALRGEFKRVSLGLAESCVSVALLALATSSDPTNTTGHGYNPAQQIVQVGIDEQGRFLECTITSVSGSGSTVRTIGASAEYEHSYSSVNVEVTVMDPVHPTGSTNIKIDSWSLF